MRALSIISLCVSLVANGGMASAQVAPRDPQSTSQTPSRGRSIFRPAGPLPASPPVTITRAPLLRDNVATLTYTVTVKYPSSSWGVQFAKGDCHKEILWVICTTSVIRGASFTVEARHIEGGFGVTHFSPPEPRDWGGDCAGTAGYVCTLKVDRNKVVLVNALSL